MRTSLIVFGVIFLGIGVLLYLVPMQEISADTTTASETGVDTRTSSARVIVPVIWSLTSAIIGIVLLGLGLAISDPTIITSDSKKGIYEKVVESKEDIDVGDGNKRKIIRQRTETRTARKDEDLA